MRDRRQDVVIAGGGMAGLALACALADALGSGAAIAAVTGKIPASSGAGDTRAVALSAASVRMLRVLGVWNAIAPHAQPVTSIDITDSSLNDALRPVLLSFDNTIAGGEPATYVVENAKVLQALHAGVGSRPAVSLKGETVCGFLSDEHAVLVRLGGGATLTSALLVGADGARSSLREAAGIKIVRWPSHQLGIVTTVRHEHPHAGRAVQHFLPSGPFAILPMTENRSCITWTEREDRARAILALAEKDFLAEVEMRFDYRLGRVALAGPRGAWPLAMHLARGLIADRFALVGDAAHGVHPLAGQGLNLGLRDVAALAEVVADAARLGLDIGAPVVLERYQRWRRLDAAISAAAFDALNRIFSMDWSVLRTARGLGVGLVERLPVLKRLLVTEAAGLAGNVPRLLRGEPV
jgi:2-octaprenyl-6-methoxyphenol hydroxylase